MDSIRFTKAHGCGNDFLMVAGRAGDFAPVERFVRAICDRHFGVGADGIYFLSAAADGADAAIELYNSDGSHAELSGNGTRCVAAALVSEAGGVDPQTVRIRTGAGVKELRLLARQANRLRFEMRIGPARVDPGPEGTLSVCFGNPQCVVFVEDFDFDWEARGRELEKHPFFPAGTNVDFVRPVDPHSIEARFWERGAGHTLASGTGSTASAVAGIHAGHAESPVSVRTEGGVLEVRWEKDSDVYLTGWAELICRGEYFWPG